MKNFEYVDYSTTTRRAWTRAREIHRQKLIDIVKAPSKTSKTPLPHFISDSKTRKRQQANNKIRKENSLIFKRLEDAPPLINTNLRSRVSTPKLNSSLYGGFENRNRERIKQENKRIAKKIITAEPSFSTKKLKKDYKEVEKLKKNICKPHSMTSNFSFFPVIRGRSLQHRKVLEMNDSSQLTN